MQMMGMGSTVDLQGRARPGVRRAAPRRTTSGGDQSLQLHRAPTRTSPDPNQPATPTSAAASRRPEPAERAARGPASGGSPARPGGSTAQPASTARRSTASRSTASRRTASPYGQPAGSPPPNYLVWAILTTLFCCLPLGVVSIVFAAQVNGKCAAGDVAGAQESSRKAKKFAIWSAVVGLVVGVLYLLVIVAARGPASLTWLSRHVTVERRCWPRHRRGSARCWAPLGVAGLALAAHGVRRRSSTPTSRATTRPARSSP